MTLVFAAFDYDARFDRVTIITPSGRTVSARAELARRSKTWLPLQEDPHALYRDFMKLFLAWVDMIEPVSADTKLVITAADIIVALIYDGVIATMSLSKRHSFHTAGKEILDGLRTMANFLPDDALAEASEIFSDLALLTDTQTAATRH